MQAEDEEKQGKALDAVLREIERREGSSRSEVQFPDGRDLHPDPAGRVELVCTVHERSFAFEHTYLEPFAGYRDLICSIRAFEADLVSLIQGDLSPTEGYDLGIPYDALKGVKPRKIRQYRDRIARLIRPIARSLPIDGRLRVPATVLHAPDMPFHITLQRRDVLAFPPRFRVVAVVPHDTEKLRRARLRRAYKNKCPKLMFWKRERDARTILILEEDDIQGTNQFLAGNAIQSIERYVGDLPDEVYLLSTHINPWYLYPIRVDRKWIYRRRQIIARFREIDPGMLKSLSGQQVRKLEAVV